MATIIRWPHESLSTIAEPLEPREINSARFKQRISDLFRLMYAYGGVGLAAPQVGWPVRLFVCNQYGRPRHKDSSFVFINPVVSKFGQTEMDTEGCLSLSGIWAKVPRSSDVLVRSIDTGCRPIKLTASGFMARIIQHENDHLDGVMFTDHVQDDEKLAAELERFKEHTELIRYERKISKQANNKKMLGRKKKRKV